MSAPSPRAAQIIIASAFIKHARANHSAPFGDCRNPECWRGYRLLMKLWPDCVCPIGFSSDGPRLAIAEMINDALPMMCRAEIVTWALGYHVIQENERAHGCHLPENMNGGACWCGKNTTPDFLAEFEAEQKELTQCQ